MDNHPFTGVYRGRVISITERQRVHGGGLILDGWGGMRVDTVTHNDFWIRSRDFGDLCFKMGVQEPPPMLLEHAVTVVTAGELVCAVANHSTGFQRLYHPKGVYKVNKGGWRFLVLTLLALGILETAGHGALVESLQIPAMLAWIGWVGISGHEIWRYNVWLDRTLVWLIKGQETERFANAKEVKPLRRLRR
jgi:hypothetical protein